MVWRATDPEGNEAEKIRWAVVPYTRGKVLDIGCGPYKAFNHFIGIDSGKQWGHPITDITCEGDDLSLFANESVDGVFSSHFLEHVEDVEKALTEWWRVIKVGGYLSVYLPHADLYPRVGKPGANADHKHDFLPDELISNMEKIGGWDLVENETRDTDNGEGEKGNEYSFLQVYRKHSDGEHLRTCDESKPPKTACVVRYGGFGDMIQASSLLPRLKEQGYHVTFMTTPLGQSIIELDPHVDEWIIQDSNQVPNDKLREYWRHWEKKFTKFVNLSESAEGTLLALYDRANHDWPAAVRNKYMNVNYVEFQHDLAGVPGPYRMKFYPSETELTWAKMERHKMGDGPVILWVLAGSAFHKMTPYADQVMARIMVEHPTVKVVLVGDTRCQMLEAGWEKEPRVIRQSGKWTIRQTLAFAVNAADLVVGPETGVLNAVGNEPVPKVIMLSHSSRENLTRYWRDTVALVPNKAKAPCYPCHQLHVGWGTCPREEVTIPMPESIIPSGEIKEKPVLCVAHLTADMIYSAVNRFLRGQVKLRASA